MAHLKISMCLFSIQHSIEGKPERFLIIGKNPPIQLSLAEKRTKKQSYMTPRAFYYAGNPTHNVR